MINALITKHIFGINENSIPFIQLVFIARDDETNSTKYYETAPIDLISKEDNPRSTALAAVFTTIFSVLGVRIWEDLNGRAAQIELDNEGRIIKIANILDETNYILIGTNTEPVDEIVEE